MSSKSVSGASVSPSEVGLEMDSAAPMAQPERVSPTVGFSSKTYAVVESAGSVTVQLVRAGPLDFPLSVVYATADDTAQAPTDYLSAAGVLEFAAGQVASAAPLCPSLLLCAHPKQRGLFGGAVGALTQTRWEPSFPPSLWPPRADK